MQTTFCISISSSFGTSSRRVTWRKWYKDDKYWWTTVDNTGAWNQGLETILFLCLPLRKTVRLTFLLWRYEGNIGNTVNWQLLGLEQRPCACSIPCLFPPPPTPFQGFFASITAVINLTSNQVNKHLFHWKHCPQSWNNFQHEKPRTLLSPGSHVMFCLLYKHQ